MNLSYLLLQYLITFGWALTGAISMAVSLGILLKIFTWINPLNEWEEVQKGNIGMAIILSSIILGSSLVIGLTLMS